MKLLILGASGMVGHKVLQVSHRYGHEVTGTVRAQAPSSLAGLRILTGVQAEQPATIVEALSWVRPEAVVNCIGLIKQLNCRKRDFTEVNALFPHVLADICQSAGARLLHLSTDCVFSGRKGGYREADQPDPVDAYGLSKLLGEPESGALTLRTSVIGPELASSNGLYEWFRSRHGQAVSGYRNAIFSGLTTLELSRVMLQVLESHPTLEGVWHVSSEPIAKLELLSKLNRAAQLGITLLPDENFVCDRSLDSIRFQSETGYRPPSWDAMVQEMVEDGKSYAVPRE